MESVDSVIASELRRRASDLYRRSDNVALGRDGSGVDRVGQLREQADDLIARAERLDVQALTIKRLEDEARKTERGKVEAFALTEYATEQCSCGDCDELGTVCGPEWFGYELGLAHALRAVETWLADPHHGPLEVLTLEVKL